MVTKEDLHPTTKQLVRNITDKLGLEMSSQYDWCFSKEGGPYLMSEWWDDIYTDKITGHLCFRDWAHGWAAQNPSALQVQYNRSSAVSNLIQTAYYAKRPLHVAIVTGKIFMEKGREKSEVYLRELDTELWYPHHKDLDGNIIVVRGLPQPDDADPWNKEQQRARTTNEPPPPPPKHKEVTKTAIFPRDREVVKAVKRRATEGRCEHCGEPGFLTLQGAHYLEAHHIIPLSCGGDDKAWNMVAICPEDHRRAHYGQDRDQLRDDFIVKVIHEHYAEDGRVLDDLDRKSLEITKSVALQRKLEEDTDLAA